MSFTFYRVSADPHEMPVLPKAAHAVMEPDDV
jgi:hypothetical protein